MQQTIVKTEENMEILGEKDTDSTGMVWRTTEEKQLWKDQENILNDPQLKVETSFL